MAGRAGDVRRIVQGNGRHRPTDVANVIAAGTGARGGRRLRTPERRHGGAEPFDFHAKQTLHAARHHLILGVPRGHSHGQGVRVHDLGERLVKVRTPRRADHLNGVHLCAGHGRGGLRHLLGVVVHRGHAVKIALTEKEPDARRARHHVGLVATVGDDVVRTLRRFHMLALVLPTLPHQHHGIERTLATPGPHRGVRARAFELEQRTDERERRFVAVRNTELAAHVGKERGVHILEHAGAHQIRLARQLLFGHPRPQHDSAL